MISEEKFSLLKDLCARLPYGVVINIGDKDLKLDRRHQDIGVLYPEDCSDEFNERNNNAGFYIIISGCYYGEEIKPYLRPMSSMTEEEKKEAKENGCIIYWDVSLEDKGLLVFTSPKGFDWLNAHHFDYRGLIEKGLALETPEGMYETEKQKD